jgi:hypothetical protein
MYKVMVRIFTFIVLWSFALLPLKAQTASTALQVDKLVHDFGEILEKAGKVSHTFIFTNTTKIPIAINGVRSGCGCTSSEYTKGPIKPNETGEVTVTYNPAYRPGFFSKEITLLFNNGKNYTRVWIKGIVISFSRPVEEDHPYNFGSGLHCSLKVLPFGALTKGETKKIRMFYANDTEKEMELLFVTEGDYPDLTFINPGKLAPKARGILEFTYTSSSRNPGPKSFNIYPRVNGKKLSNPLVVSVKEVNN